MGDTNAPQSQLVIESAEPPAVVALPTRAPVSDGTAAEVEDLEEIMLTGERLPAGLFPSELSSERAGDGVWVDGDGQPIRDEEEE